MITFIERIKQAAFAQAGARTMKDMLLSMRRSIGKGIAATPAQKNLFSNIKNHIQAGGKLTDTAFNAPVRQAVQPAAMQQVAPGIKMYSAAPGLRGAVQTQRAAAIQAAQRQGSATGRVLPSGIRVTR